MQDAEGHKGCLQILLRMSYRKVSLPLQKTEAETKSERYQGTALGLP